MTTNLSANGGALSVLPTRRFGYEAVSYELRGLTKPDSTPADDAETARLLNEGWADELPSLEKYDRYGGKNAVRFGNHEIVEQTYVPIRHESPVNSFLEGIGRYIPKDSYIKNPTSPLEYYTSTLIRAKETQPYSHNEFTAHPLVALRILKSWGDLGRAGYTALPVNGALAKYFPNVVKLFTQVTDPDKRRTILGDARALIDRADPLHRKGLFFPVLESIHQSIR
jgi:hypothetical protein